MESKLFCGPGSNRPRRQQSSGARKLVGLLSALVITLTVVPTLSSQEPPQQGPKLGTLMAGAKMHRAPLPHLYMNFLLHQNRLDKVAAERDSQGKNGALWRNYFQERLSFTDSEMATVRHTALRLESELKDIGAQAVAIAKANRAARAAANISAPIQSDPRLRDLTRQREETIQTEMENLNNALGPVASAKLSTFIQTRYQEHEAFRKMLRPHAARPKSSLHAPPSGQEEKQQEVKP